jgi:hypothetical protein
MKKLLFLILLVVSSALAIGQTTGSTQANNIIIKNTAPYLHLNGMGAMLNFYNGDIKLIRSASGVLSLTGGILKIGSDTAGVRGVRDSDGHLPELQFLRLASTSDGIDAGVDVGIAFESTAPDIGAYEFIPPNPSIEPTVVNVSKVVWVKWAVITSNACSDGGGTVSARGVCWKTSTGPTTADSKTSDGTGIGIYTSSLTGLLPNTTYYLRAYATNEAGTAYGSEIVFTTPKYTALKNGTKVLVSGGKVLVIK